MPLPNILVVDDDKNILELLKMRLARECAGARKYNIKPETFKNA